ncbi:MAG: DUF5011 domain-containing protein [Firmicutes bacterium]|nr:DUF5011 domain-containing protein [Bacillota bacterium]
MSFLLWLTSFMSIWTVQVEWIHQILDIPLFDNVGDYKEIPEAELYIDGIKVNDPYIYYERDGVDHTFFSVITSSHVRTFTIRYRVHFPTYDVIHTQDIVFNIVDLIPPVIDQVSDFRVPLGQSMPDLDVGFIYFDNYDEMDSLLVSINSMEVILDETGIYPVYYQVSDLSGNMTYTTGLVEVYDFLAPVISLDHPIILAFEDPFIWQDFIDVKDNDDVYPYVRVDDSMVDYTTLGDYTIQVYAMDKNGLSSTKNFDISIVDEVPPIITLKSAPPPIPVFSNVSDIDFLSYVIRIEDNYDLLQIERVTYDHDIEFNVLGQYDIYYQLIDYSGNQTEVKMKISVIDDLKPEILILYPLIFDVFDVEPFFIDYIDYFDNYTSHDQLSLKMSESVKMDVIGMYPLTIDVTDGSGNKTTLRTYIEIIDPIEPDIIQLNDIIITDFTQKDLTYYFEASDNYDDISDIEVIVDDTLVDYEQIGMYSIKVLATDLSKNCAVYDAELMVLDIEEPEFVLIQSILYIDIYSSPLDYSSFLVDISDNYDLLSILDITYEGEVDYNNLGIYPIEFTLQDTSLNTISKTLYITVDDLVPPTIESSTLTLYIGDFFDPLIGLEVYDNLGSVDVTCFPQLLDTSTPGTKIVNYVVMDQRGNYTTYQRTVIVEPLPQTINPIDYIPVVLVSIIGISAGIYFYKKMS